jgi:hypothetical protein
MMNMNSKQLIEQVEAEKQNGWKNSDVGKISEKLFEKIVSHFELCGECRKDFDTMEYPENTLIEFEHRLTGTKLKDWICRTRNSVPSDKEYWRGKGANPRTICPECGRYMHGVKCLVTVGKTRKWINGGELCKCGKFIPDLESLKAFP